MSRIGRLPIRLPEGVSLDVAGRLVKVTGPKGTLERRIPSQIVVEKKEDLVVVVAKGKSKRVKALHGTTRANLANMVHGVSEGWSKTLELVGTGYKAEGAGSTLILSVGYSHPVKIDAPNGISFKIEKTEVIIEGTNKELVGQTAAKIRGVRPPEPYKGKGIKYKDEIIRRKPGKAARAEGVGA